MNRPSERGQPCPRERTSTNSRTRRSALLFIAASLAIRPLLAETPVVDYFFPAGGKAGTTVQVTAGGKLDPWPAKVWTDSPGLTFKAEESKGKLSVEIAANAPAGAHLVRIYNQDGASNVRCFIVGQIDEQSEKEPNDDPQKAQLIEKFPVTMNGQWQKSGDTDSFAFDLKEGQWLVAEVAAYSIDSPVDPTLHLLDQQGTKLAFNHDGRGLDPLLAYRAEKGGRHVLQLGAFAYPPKADVKFSGSESSVYRITLTTGPYARYAFPAGVQRGEKATLHLFGWNLGTTGDAIVHQLDASGFSSAIDQTLLAVPGLDNCLRIPVSHHPEELEIEPNGTLDLAQTIKVPGSINGQINPASDEDRFRFAAKKDEKFNIRVRSAALDFPLDAVLKIEDQKGSQLMRGDDQGRVEDPELNWTAPSDGSFLLCIGDLLKRGGRDYVYRIEITHPKPAFKASLEGPAFKLEPGKSIDLKVNVSRLHDFRENLIVAADGLPEGVVSTAVNVPEKGGAVTVTLSASAEAKPANQPIRLLAIAANPDAAQVRLATVNLKGQNAAAGDLQINHTESIWLTVLPKPPPPPKKEENTKP
jgi:hypothetical protein